VSDHDLAQKGTYYAPWERSFDRITTPFEDFLHDQTAGGLVLLACTVIALVIANSPLASAYDHVLHTYLGITIGDWSLKHSVHHWINDGLMALFFFVVGLEIKREVIAGELSDIRAAILPIIAAVGGMIIPALIYTAVAGEGMGARGWGVPMATDIAFAVGVLALLGSRVPKALPTFLVAVAIVDDMGAVAVIALFYTDHIVMQALLAAGVFFAVLVVFNRLGIRNPAPYFIVGIFLWMSMLESGVHATIAGILTAMTIPARVKYEPKRFVNLMRETLDKFEREAVQFDGVTHTGKRRALLRTMENGVHMAEAPLQRLEHSMHISVAFVIIPLFALANAGVPIEFATLGQTLTAPVTLGVIFGLVFGKVVGIGLLPLLAVRLGLAQMPTGTTAMQIIGVGFLGGIGFTMSIFIAELAFKGQLGELVMAKTGILAASLIAGLIGYFMLRATGGEPQTQIDAEAGT
jgi:NhaA family Na+:H+ antiporter